MVRDAVAVEARDEPALVRAVDETPQTHAARGYPRPPGSAGTRTRGAHLLDVLHRRAQVGEPRVGVLADELHAPGEGVGARPRDAGVDEGVEDLTLRLAQPGHDRDGEVGEQLAPVAALDAPRDLAVAAVLDLAGDLDAGVAGVLAERLDPAGGRGRAPASEAPAASSGSASRPTTVISSRSTVTSGASANQSAGRRPASQPRMLSVSRCRHATMIT